MIRLDRIDNKIIALLKKGSLNLNQLWIKCFAREGAKVWKERLDRLVKLKVINVNIIKLKGKTFEYVISLK